MGILRAYAFVSTAFSSTMNGAAVQQGLVTATFRQRMRLRLEDGSEVMARLKGKRIRAVCGDQVDTQGIPNEPDWLITAIHPRRNELSRPDRRGRAEVLAANIDLIAVVTADAPTTDWFIVDRYLAAAALIDASAIVVFNKIDLGAPSDRSADELANFSAIGYPTVHCSARQADGLDELRHRLDGHTAIIVGQSGVGKSSLINGLVENADQQTARLSDSSGEGRHTTVNSVLWSLPGGGAVIDSPGVRDYAPAISAAERVVFGFKEIAAKGENCRFANCRHLREPDCAVKAAMERGDISARRYESYRRLLRLAENAD